MENEENFSDKYLKSNFLIRKLIKNFYRRIEETLSGLEIEKVLEVGCGAGFSTRYLSNMLKNKDFQASEYRLDLVRESQKRNPKIKIQQESIYELKREDNSFDLIMVLEVLEHLEDPELALEELNRVTSRYCLLSIPNEPLWRILNVLRFKYLRNFGNTPGHLHHWSKNKFLKLLKKFYQIKKVKMSLPWIIVLVEKI